MIDALKMIPISRVGPVRGNHIRVRVPARELGQLGASSLLLQLTNIMIRGL
jgi:hypothetical protein